MDIITAISYIISFLLGLAVYFALARWTYLRTGERDIIGLAYIHLRRHKATRWLLWPCNGHLPRYLDKMEARLRARNAGA